MSTPDPTDIVDRCLPFLTGAATDWELRGMQDAPLLVCAATPHAGVVIRAEGWPQFQHDDYARDVLTALLTAAIEAPTSDENCRIVLAMVAYLLGETGREEHLEAVTRIRGNNEIPLLSMMTDGNDVVTFTASVPCVPPPGATVH